MRTYRSFFWPGALVLIGLLALLVNTGLIQSDRLYQLIDLWPAILIVIGIEIIVRRTLTGAVATGVALAVVLVAVVGAGAYVTLSPTPGQVQSFDASRQLEANRQAASVVVDAGAGTIRIDSDATLETDLYRVHADYTGKKPTVTFDATGTLHISQSDTAFPALQPHRLDMTLALNPKVIWSIVENTGAVSETMSLADARLEGIRLNTGASREDITLGAPSGAVPIEINGGALTVAIHRAGGADASVKVSGGAVTLNADGQVNRGFGSVSYETPSQGADRYVISVNGGACTVTLDSTGSAPPPQP